MLIITEPEYDGIFLMTETKVITYISIPAGLCIFAYILMGLLYLSRRRKNTLLRKIATLENPTSAEAKSPTLCEDVTQGMSPTETQGQDGTTFGTIIAKTLNSTEQPKLKRSKKKTKSLDKKSKLPDTDQSPLPKAGSAPIELNPKTTEQIEQQLALETLESGTGTTGEGDTIGTASIHLQSQRNY
uniref:Uncharacterized protein n=1 Tax=Caenorhabditis japonica TaxID=281687 RepID=A0A8R1DM76_CAEJA